MFFLQKNWATFSHSALHDLGQLWNRCLAWTVYETPGYAFYVITSRQDMIEAIRDSVALIVLGGLVPGGYLVLVLACKLSFPGSTCHLRFSMASTMITTFLCYSINSLCVQDHEAAKVECGQQVLDAGLQVRYLYGGGITVDVVWFCYIHIEC